MKRIEARDSQEILAKYKCLLFDLDGTIWIGNKLLDGVAEALESVSQKCQCLFLTNNATASRQHYAEKCHDVGLRNIKVDQIYTSGSASAYWLKHTLLPTLPEDRRDIYLIGQRGLEDELSDQGLQWTGGTDPEDNILMPNQDFSSIQPNPRIGVVLQGFDMHITYKKLCKAYNYLSQNKGCQLVLTNADRDVFTETAVCPGEGALAAVLTSTFPNPRICGKPEPALLDVILQKHGLKKEDVLMVGDRLETDIAFSRKGGIDSLLVLTGSTHEDQLKDTPEHERPTYLAQSVAMFGVNGVS